MLNCAAVVTTLNTTKDNEVVKFWWTFDNNILKCLEGCIIFTCLMCLCVCLSPRNVKGLIGNS